MERNKSGTSICIVILVVFGILSTVNEWGLIFGYVVENPSNLPFYFIYVCAGVIGLISWLIVGYRGRPLNTSSYSHTDDLTSMGYIDYERRKDYE
jgi:hypothetical protein